MGELIKLDDFRSSWHEVLTLVSPQGTTLQVFLDRRTGRVDLVQVNDEGEALRSELSPEDAQLLVAAIQCKTAPDHGS